MDYTLWLVFLVGIIALVYACYLARKVSKYDVGNQKMQEISRAIQEGALAFLYQEYKIMAWFIVIFGALIALFLDHGVSTALAFVFGCVTSILAGYIGMRIATLGNVRTTFQAQKSLSKAFQVAFESGSVMGLGLVSFAVLGLGLLYILFSLVLGYQAPIVMEIMAGFALGASSIALFARVGGGIYTKAADVGADLVGKVEKGIPEDDPRNPAVIADNVGDNVGDIAGMGADLFGSCAESTCSALLIGAVVFAAAGLGALLYPLLISVIGIVACFITLFLIKLPEGKENVESVLKRGLIISSLLVAVALYFVTTIVLPAQFELFSATYTSLGVYFAVLSGIISGLLIGIVTEYYTSHRYKPVRSVANASKTGAATNIIYGLALGYESSVLPIILLAITVFVAYSFAGFYGIAIAAIGMLSTLVLGLAIDAYGPVSDNAGGIAEMAGLDKSIRKRTDVLDAAGNTTAAIGKGFAIGSAVLTGLALFSAFTVAGSVGVVDLLSPLVISGLFIGALLPFIFSALTMKSVGKAALSMVEEVRRQFKTIKGLMQGKAKPDYKKCVMISTEAALKEMILPGILVLGTPLVVGLLFGVQALAGVLMGSIVTGAVLAIASANSGGAWDNAKKYIEAGNLGGKGSDVHKAAVVGDTVGDPFKDTSGPSLNILIKLMSITSLVFVPLFVKYGGLLLR
ncbi:V-type H(+)-translocating pyrophosphatase [Candidatus Woesearchaeota archaeon]|nr:V-type H(+)-translocating pyrophosphatase [Candidatus Woesearchaeota archaeon]